MVNRHMKRYSLITKELQIKTTVRYYLRRVRMVDIKKKTIDNTCWRVYREKVYTVCRNVHCYNHYGKQYVGSFKN